MGLIEWAIAATGAALLLAWAVGIAKPRRLREGELGYERDAFPLFLNRPGLGGSVASIVGAAWAAVPVAETVRFRKVEFGCEVDIVVPWTHVEPWGRRALQSDAVDAVESVRCAGTVAKVRVTWR
jgi:hypothetical protein